jgi:manganese/zinc/iron transport system substrate-binding protein
MNVSLRGMLRAVVAIAACSLAGWGLTGCTQADADGERGRLVVVCTTTMIADLARELAGDAAVVVSIMKVGEDPHIYKVRPSDAQAIASAGLVLYNGLNLEATLTPIITGKARRHVALAEDPAIQLLTEEEDADAPDPHCWMNVEYFKVYAQKALAALIEADPDNAAIYEANATRYLAQLDELHRWVTDTVETIPQPRRVLITSHDAFRYLGEAYNIEVHALIGISTEQAVRPRDVEDLIKLVRSRGVKALFIETSVSATLNDLVRKVAAETGAKIGGELYSDALGEPGSGADTYLGMMRHNVHTIVEALK